VNSLNKLNTISVIIFIFAVIFLIYRTRNEYQTNKVLSATIRDIEAENRSLNIQMNLVNVKYSLIGRRMPEFRLKYINSDSIYQYKSMLSNKYLLLIFFTPLDCGTCLNEIPFWETIRKSFQEQLTVFGVGAYDDFEIMKQFVKNEKINIPVLYDQYGALLSKLDLDRIGGTPLKVFVTKDGLILNINSSTFNDLKKQEEYIHRIDEILYKNNKKNYAY